MNKHPMCTPLRHNIILTVNVDRTHDLQIFNLTLSQLSYPRNVVMIDVILGLIIMQPYVEVVNYTQVLSIIPKLAITWQYINLITNMLYPKDLVFC